MLYTGFPVGSVERNPPSMQKMQEMRVWSLGWEDPLEEEMATHSSTLAWKIPWTEEPGGLQSAGSQRVRHHWGKWRMHAHIHMHDTWMCLCVYLYMYSHVCSVTDVLSHFSHVWLLAVFKLEGNERESCRVNKREQWWEVALHPAFLWGCVWNQGSESNAPTKTTLQNLDVQNGQCYLTF